MSDQPEEKKPIRKPRITPHEWAKIESLVELGQQSMSQIAKDHGITLEYLSRRMKAKGIKKGSKAAEHAKEIKDSVQRRALDDANIVAERIRDTKEKHFRYMDSMEKLGWSKVAEAVKDHKPLAMVMPELKAIEKAIQVFRSTREEKYELLGLNSGIPDASELPELAIIELTADEIEEMRNKQAQADPNLIGQDLIPETELGELNFDDLDDE